MSDLISRQAAIDAIEEYADRLQIVDWKENPGVPYKAYALNWCINTIRDLPSAQPVRHGKWIRENHYGMWKCSECGCRVRRANPLKGNIWNYYYCPNCGAKMDAERKEE